jgi:xanthine dehydrogenase accessory factor
VKHWQEMAQILDRAIRLGREGKATALATVVQIRGSAYRRPGAKLLVEGENPAAALGSVSGGCLEEDVREIGGGVRRDGRSRVLHYDTGSDEHKLWGLGLGCDGEIDILVQPISAEAAVGPWSHARELLAGDAPFAVTSVVEEQTPPPAGAVLVSGPSGRVAGSLGDVATDAAAVAAAADALVAGASRVDTVAGRRLFTEVLLPPPKLLVCGAGDDARPLASFAAAVGFRVVVADHRPAYLTAQRFPDAQLLLLLRPEESAAVPASADTYAVIKTHALGRDTEWVRRLLATAIPYVGVLGPRSRIEKIEKKLAEGGAAATGRLFGPVGLDIGADGPEQVAVAVVAELLAVRAKRMPRHLRERTEPIHV